MIQISQYIINQIYCFFYVTILYLLYYTRLMKIILEKKDKVNSLGKQKTNVPRELFWIFPLCVVFIFVFIVVFGCLEFKSIPTIKVILFFPKK